MTDLFCNSCGARVRPTAKFCPVCSHPVTQGPIVPSSGGSPPPTQVFQTGGGQGAELVLPDQTSLPLYSITTIGRDPARCNLTLPDDERVSRLHARIEEQAGMWTLTDLGSANGTFVNNLQITAPTVLNSGDQVGIGKSIYLFRLAGQSPQISGSAWQPGPLVRPGVVQQGVVPQGPPGFPGPVQNWGPTPIQQAPSGGWRRWNKLPLAEGYVRSISDRYMMKKDDLVKRGIAAAALALFISPALAFLPFMHGNEIAARDLRIEDYQTGRQMDVKMLGDVMGNINQGDAIAVWGEQHGGLLIMHAAYNYDTDSEIRIKK